MTASQMAIGYVCALSRTGPIGPQLPDAAALPQVAQNGVTTLAGQMRPSQARPYWAEPLLACLVAVTPQSPDNGHREKNFERLPRSTPEAAYSLR